MKAILISDKAKWCALMMNGDKNIEVRTSKALANAIQKLIDEQGFADIYVYCSKGKPNLWLPYEYDCFKLDISSQPYLSNKPIIDCDYKMNGKVVFKFRCYKVEETTPFEEYESPFGMAYKLKDDKVLCCYKAHLTYDEYNQYIKGKKGYAIHIADLEIFDKPKELSEFYTTKLDEDLIKRLDNSIQLENGTWVKRITKAPQNYCYVEVE